MTLDEAIKHAEEVANACSRQEHRWNDEWNLKISECANEHRQLAAWLRELRELRKKNK